MFYLWKIKSQQAKGEARQGETWYQSIERDFNATDTGFEGMGRDGLPVLPERI